MMRIIAIHMSFAIGIALAPLSGLAGERLPVPNATFQYLDKADFECPKEQPHSGLIVSHAVPMRNLNGSTWFVGRETSQIVSVHRATNVEQVVVESDSTFEEKLMESKAFAAADFTIEYSAQVCVGFVETSVVGGTWSIFGESEKHKISAKGDFSEQAVEIELWWQDEGLKTYTNADGHYDRKWFPRQVDVIIIISDFDVAAVEKSGFHRRFEESFAGRLDQTIEFQFDKPAVTD